MNEIQVSLKIDDLDTNRHYESGFLFKDLKEFDNLFETLRLSIKSTIELNTKKLSV
jgi:hypothetical protein